MQNGLAQRFQQLTKVLQQYRPYWQLLPFSCDQLPWSDDRLQQCVQALDEQKVKQIDQCERLQKQYFGQFFPALFDLTPLMATAACTPLTALPFWLENGIGGRKLQQIDALCQQWPSGGLPVVE